MLLPVLHLHWAQKATLVPIFQGTKAGTAFSKPADSMVHLICPKLSVTDPMLGRYGSQSRIYHLLSFAQNGKLSDTALQHCRAADLLQRHSEQGLCSDSGTISDILAVADS